MLEVANQYTRVFLKGISAAQTMVKTHTFNDRRYKIDTGPVDGTCDQYKCNERYVTIFADLNTRKGLITAMHEALHAENWTASEEVVERVSREIGSFLWRLGYRKSRGK